MFRHVLYLHQAEALDQKRQQLALSNLKAIRAEAMQEKAEREAECWMANFELMMDKAVAEIEEMERKRDKWRKRARKMKSERDNARSLYELLKGALEE